MTSSGNALSAVFDKTGDGVLITHSQGGGPGWRIAIKNPKVRAVISYEPGSSFADEWNKDSWRIRLDMAHKFAAAVNRHGGDCTVVHLPEIGVTGNTHFPFSDLNNVQIADLMQNWLHEKGLDK